MRTNALLLPALSLLLAACGGAPNADGGQDLGAESLSAPPNFAGDTANHATFATDISVWETPIAESQMDCLWGAGVRHVIVGTQEATIAKQQLAMAVSRGMTVDAYVYIYWDRDFVAQVEAAFDMVKGFPIGSMWLDIEEQNGAAALGSNMIVSRIQAGLSDCEAHGVGCGIYTSPGFWKSYASNTSTLASTPLWYALYNGKRSLSDWSTEHFGGWNAPVGKQFQTAPLCGMGGADWDILQVSATPTVVVDRTPQPDTGLPPAAPTGLFPEDGSVDLLGYAKLMSGTVPNATSYQLALETWTGTKWVSYYTWTSPDAYVKANLPSAPAVYRLRVRAQNAHGFGAWSSYATFDFGHYTGVRPSASAPAPTATTTAPAPTPTTAPPAPTTAPPAPTSTAPAPAPTTPPPSDVPGSLAPSGGQSVSSSGVTLSCDSLAGATRYQFAIEYATPSGWASYYTYTDNAPSQTFYPATRGIDYRFQVRALINGAYGAWSGYATFHVN